MRLKRYLKDKETRKLKKNLKESKDKFDNDAAKILKKLKIPFVKSKEPKWKDDDTGEIEFTFDQTANGNYMLGIQNYTQSTNWENFEVYSKFFETEDEFMKKTKGSLNRYKKQGWVFHSY